MKDLKIFMLMLLALTFIHINVFALTGEGISDSVILDTVNPQVTVNYPNGNENFYAGDSIAITWNATDFSLTGNPIKIYHSNDSGINYTELANSEANDGTYHWEIPSTVSNTNLIKIDVADAFGNVGTDLSDGLFTISYAPPATPSNVSVDLSNNLDAVITWTAVDSTIFGNPIAVDGYIVLYNEIPYEDATHSYQYLDYTNNTTYIHNGALESNTQIFYKIVAYKDYRENIKSVLKDLSNTEIKWSDLQRRFK